MQPIEPGAWHVFQHEALAERVLQIVGIEPEILARSAGRSRRDHPHRRDGQPSTVFWA
jgi:hypothetical protein